MNDKRQQKREQARLRHKRRREQRQRARQQQKQARKREEDRFACYAQELETYIEQRAIDQWLETFLRWHYDDYTSYLEDLVVRATDDDGMWIERDYQDDARYFMLYHRNTVISTGQLTNEQMDAELATLRDALLTQTNNTDNDG